MKHCTLCKTKYDDAVSFCSVDGEVLEEDLSSLVGTVLDGQYQIESLLGKGGMGAVFLARHILLGDRVAIKVLPKEMRNNAEWLRRFRREGQAARRFRHPNAVTVYDLRTAADGTIYMVMEYVDGHTLFEEMKARGRFSPGEAVSAMDPILSVLNEAHAMGVVHRDLKPENIMFGRAGTGGTPQVKLLDLGIAKLREVAGAGDGGNTALTMAGQMLGTPYYMSPEQWGELPLDGNPEIDGRADIYSLGLVFYEMIAGIRPYSALTLLELRKEHVSVVAPELNEIIPEVPEAFSNVIARAMAKDRGDRPATAGKLANELKEALAASGVSTASFVPLINEAGSTANRAQAPTITIGQAAITSADVDAATIIELAPGDVDKPATPRSGRVTAGPGSPAPAGLGTVAEPRDLGSSATAPRAPKQPESPSAAATVVEKAKPLPAAPQVIKPEPVTPQVAPPAVVADVKKPSRMPLIIVAVVVLLAVGVGGFFGIKALRGTGTGPVSSGANTNGTQPPPTTREAARFWLEISAEQSSAKSVRVAPLVPVASGQYFKLHLVPNAAGYFYIIGPGEKNKLTAFLTAKPAVLSGLTSNDVKSGEDFNFPKGDENWLKLDENPGAEEYTVVFSATPLNEPKFLTQQATGNPLNDTDKIELTAFFARYKSGSPTIESNADNGAAPFVLVKVPSSFAAGNPLVFDVRIEHR